MTAYSSGDDDLDRHWNEKNGYVNPDGSRGPAWDNPHWREERERTMAPEISPDVLGSAAAILEAMVLAGFPPAGVSYRPSDHPQDDDRFEVRLALGGGTATVSGQAKALVALFGKMAERRRRVRKGGSPPAPENAPAATGQDEPTAPARDREPTGRQRP